MSMFHELMMRKKEQIMYATIKGTLTENDGVFSGFSASNYLQLQQNLDSDNLEMVIDFTTGDSIIGGRVVFMNRSTFDLEVYGGGLSSYNWQNSTYKSVIPSTDYSVNTNYKVKIIRSGNTISFAYSKNGGAYISTATFTTTKTVTNPATFGTSPVETSRYFNGSINFNQSYIKIDNTKYKLQVVVGYTIVGSPTIVDGVASGFSASDYLTFPTILSKYSSDDINRVEMGIKITTGNSVGLSGLIVNSNYYYNGLLIGSNTKPSFFFNLGGVDNAVSDVVLQPNTEYTIIGILDKKTNSIKISVNGIVNTNTANYFTFSNNQATGIGYGYRTGAFEGSIDLKSTYIKVNNKLYFNGQQA